jgi:hypothetical protein
MRHRWGTGLLSLVFAAGLTGCLASAQPVYDSDVEPPPPQYEQVTERPGYVWIDGYWGRVNNDWRWQPGHYETARQGYAWRAGGWNRQGNRWHYNEGRWEQSSGPSNVIIRDHRRGSEEPVHTQQTPLQPDQPPPGTIVVPSRDPH